MSRLVGLLLLGFALGATATWAFQAGYRTPSRLSGAESSSSAAPAQRAAPSKRAVFALGTLEPRGGSVMVTSALVGTPVREVLVREGETVKAAQRLLLLDTTVAEEELKIAQTQRLQALERQQTEVTLAKQREEAANLALDQAKAAQALEIDAQQKQIDVSEAKLRQAQDDLIRLQALQRGERPLVSQQQLDHQRTLLKLAEVENAAAKVALARIEQNLKFSLQKAETEKRAAEEAVSIASRGTALATLDRQIKLAEYKLAQTRVAAPSAGTVISILARPGELVSTQPLIQLANLSALECLAEVDVADLSLLKDRHDAFISCRAFRGTKIKASIERIRNVAGAATLRPVDPRKSVDRTVATIVLKLNADEAVQLVGSSVPDAGSALMGLQVDVEIPLQD